MRHGKIRIDGFDENNLYPISELKPHPENPNKHTEEQLAVYAAILEHQGVRQPVRISLQSGFVIKGHGQILASKRLGWTHVPIEVQPYDSPEQEYADLVADNALARQSEIDYGMIHQSIPQFGPELDLKHLGLPSFTVDPSESGRQVSFTAKTGSKEIGQDEFQKFNHKCPRCQFEFGNDA